jgi:hypothetical protein
MVTIDSLAEQSIKEHEEMSSLLSRLQGQLTANSLDSIKEFNQSFTSLQSRVQFTDIKLNRLLNQAEILPATQELLDKRLNLQAQVLGQLKEALAPATKIKSLLASEMNTISKGRTAISGYRSNAKKQGRIVSNSY